MDALIIAGLGGVLALDATSVGQFMVSRPLVAGAVVGWVLGDPALGLLLGAILELYLLVSFPSGGSRFPEGATATVVAVATASALEGPGAVALGAAAGLVWGQVGGLSITWLRRVNGRFAPLMPETPHPRLVGAHMLALALDFLRGAVVTLTGLLIATPVTRLFAESWPLPEQDTLGLLLVGGAVSGGILLRDLGGFRRRKVLFAVGFALGLVGMGVL